MKSLENIINKIWSDIHGEWAVLFYWNDGTTTAYRYDSATNSIRSDNGFSVEIAEDTPNITKKYIEHLIDELESKIISYYRTHHNKKIYYND